MFSRRCQPKECFGVGAHRDKDQQKSNSIYSLSSTSQFNQLAPSCDASRKALWLEKTWEQVPMQVSHACVTKETLHPLQDRQSGGLCRGSHTSIELNQTSVSYLVYSIICNLDEPILRINLWDALKGSCAKTTWQELFMFCRWRADEDFQVMCLISDSALKLLGSGVSAQVYDCDIFVVVSD